MTAITETGSWDAAVRQIETAEFIPGGPGGVANEQAQALANRTRYLRNILDSFSGVVLPHSGFSAPPGFVFAFGQELLRSSEPALFEATTIQTTGDIVSGSASISGLPIDLTPFGIESAKVEGAGVPAGANIPPGRTISSIDSATQVTLSSGTGVTAGTASIRFGVVDGAVLGASGGSHVQKLTTGQMPLHSHTVNNASGTLGGGTYDQRSSGNPLGAQVTTQSAGGDQAHPNVHFIVKL